MSETDLVLRKANWTMRLAAFVFLSVLTFVAQQRNSAQLDAKVVAFVLAGVALAAWALGDRSPDSRARFARWRPAAFGLMTVAGGAVSATSSGGASIGLSIMATLWAGDTSLVAGYAIAGLGVVAVEVGGLVYGDSSWVVFGYPLFLVVALLVGHNRRSYRLQAEQSQLLLAQVDQLRIEQHRVDVLDERTRIAREIHDVLAHSLGALSLEIQAARVVLGEQDDRKKALELLDQAQRMAKDGLVETRRAVLALRTDTLPLADVLGELVESHRSRHCVEVSLRVEGEPYPLSFDAALALTRTAQEMLVNRAKHAPFRAVSLWLSFEDNHTVLVSTNGLVEATSQREPAYATVNGGFGLTGMRERLLLLGGTLDAGPDDAAWVVTARVPR